MVPTNGRRLASRLSAAQRGQQGASLSTARPCAVRRPLTGLATDVEVEGELPGLCSSSAHRPAGTTPRPWSRLMRALCLNLACVLFCVQRRPSATEDSSFIKRRRAGGHRWSQLFLPQDAASIAKAVGRSASVRLGNDLHATTMTTTKSALAGGAGTQTAMGRHEVIPLTQPTCSQRRRLAAGSNRQS
jgi:hypothetical protein